MRRQRFVLHPSWLLTGPALIWLFGALWIPIMAPETPPLWSWILALAALALMIGCQWLHALAHAWAANSPPPGPSGWRVSISLFGDASQQWSPCGSPLREALTSLAGPAISLGLAGLSYLAWDLQPGRGFNELFLFLALFNLLVAMANLAPGFPLDGGRLVGILLSWKPFSEARRIVRWLGWAIEASFALWGGILIVAQARFSLELGLASLFLVGLLAWVGQSKPVPETPAWMRVPAKPRFAIVTTTLVVLLLGFLASTIVPLAEGLETPGLALAVEPMIWVDPPHREGKTGQFLLTSVISQTPILLGQRLAVIFDPSSRIIPPQQIVPPDTTPQELMRVNFQALEDSQLYATLVAFRLAGYDPSLAGDGIGVQEVLPESLATERLRPGDIITSLNDQPVTTVEELQQNLRSRTPSETVRLGLRREGTDFMITTELLPGAEPGNPPRIGILVQTVDLRVKTPFPVSIQPQKIVGGPSAGLMFTLTLYNLIVPEDLTRGRTIAGTGTIDAEGKVGPIGGVEQKVVAAERAGASIFLCPAENFADAQRVARTIHVWKVNTALEAVDLLRRSTITP